MNFNWPQTEHNGMIPWWQIAWRFPFFILLHVLKVVTSVVVFCGWGPHEASRIWKGMT